MDNSSEYEEARLCAHRVLRSRERTSSDLNKRLTEKGHSQEVVQQIVKRFIEVGLVDDKRYVELYIRESQRSGKGWRRIQHELRQRGIPTEDLELLEPPLDEEELERAKSILERLHIETTHKDREKALRRLHNKGYNIDIAKKAIAEFTQENRDW